MFKMAKKTKTNKEEKKEVLHSEKFLSVWVFGTIILVLIILSIVLAVFLIKYDLAKKEKEQEKYGEWLVENCNCLEKERILCPEGFELSETGGRCIDENRFTNVLRACSKYNCLNEIIEWGNGKWQKNQN